jgi:glutamate dehydrogenase
VATKPDEAKAAVIGATIARVRERIHGPEADELERFVRAYYEHAAPEDLVERSDLELSGAALARPRARPARRTRP